MTMNKTPLQKLIAEFTDVKYTAIIKRAKELLAEEESLIIQAVNDTDKHCVKQANAFLEMCKVNPCLEHEKSAGEKYFNSKFEQ